MKKLLLSLLAVASMTAANAQKGTWLIYGNVGVNRQITNDDINNDQHKMMSWNINPGIGYQFNKNWTVGVQGGYMSHKNETTEYKSATSTYPVNSTKLDNKTNSWSVGLFLRHTYYISNIFFVYSQLDLSYLAGKTDMDSLAGIAANGAPVYREVEASKYNGFGVSWTPSIGIFVHKGMALNFNFGGLGYTTKAIDTRGTNKLITDNEFNFSWGHQINAGISVNICGPKMHHGHHAEPGTEMRKAKKHTADEDDE